VQSGKQLGSRRHRDGNDSERNVQTDEALGEVLIELAMIHLFLARPQWPIS
jgi:hypothetical protein